MASKAAVVFMWIFTVILLISLLMSIYMTYSGMYKGKFLGIGMGTNGYNNWLVHGVNIGLAVGFLGSVITGLVSADKISKEGFLSLYGM